MDRLQIISWQGMDQDCRVAISDVENLVNTEITSGVLYEVEVRDIRTQTFFANGQFSHVVSVLYAEKDSPDTQVQP